MTSMTHHGPEITDGVDTHGLTHHAAVIDQLGRHLADREFPATVSGYRDLLDWMRSHGTLTAVGVEGTGAYGAELARVLTAAGVTVVDVDRPDRKTRRLRGKADPIDAYGAATAVASGRATGIPKSRDGLVEAVRVLRVVRRSGVRARTQAMNQIRSLPSNLHTAAAGNIPVGAGSSLATSPGGYASRGQARAGGGWRGVTQAVKVGGRSGESLGCGLLAMRPGLRTRLCQRLRRHSGRKGERRSLSERDCNGLPLHRDRSLSPSHCRHLEGPRSATVIGGLNDPHVREGGLAVGTEASQAWRREQP